LIVVGWRAPPNDRRPPDEKSLVSRRSPVVLSLGFGLVALPALSE